MSGWDYAWIHLQYTIPPAVLLTLVLAPLLTRIDLYKITFLITVAVVWTIPWDSYLIQHSIWTYPPNGIIGWTIFRIPVEELFFFVVQTYNTSLLYILLTKPTLFPLYLIPGRNRKQDGGLLSGKRMGQIFISGLILSQWMIKDREGTYLRLIILWACPVLLLLWSLAYEFIVRLPWTKVALPILLPTVYLWIVDTVALYKGVWAIAPGTKLGVQLWPAMEIEEAIFFLLTNVLVVFGLVAFDYAYAVIESFPSLFTHVKSIPTPFQLVEALLLPVSKYDHLRLQGLYNAYRILQHKSRSFYLASSVFSGPLRIDLIFLYAYCRIADDLVDNAKSPEEAEEWINRLQQYLDLQYKDEGGETLSPATAAESVKLLKVFPLAAQLVMLQLPTSRLTARPLYDLLSGFRTDLEFCKPVYPIKNMSDLALYSHRVASTIALLCLDLVYYHFPNSSSTSKSRVSSAAIEVGKALQFINIARDVAVDAQLNRCYLPTNILRSAGSSPEVTIPIRGQIPAVALVRKQLIHEALKMYGDNVHAIDHLPKEARGGIRVAVESYVEIGRVLDREGFGRIDNAMGSARKATVSPLRRTWIAWSSMMGL